MRKPIRTMISAAIIAMMTSQTVNAGGFSLYTEGSAAAIGNYAAGIAAEGYDASIGWYNPAGLVLIKNQQALLGGVGVFPSIDLTGNSTYSTINVAVPQPSPPFIYVEPFSGLQGGETAGIPSFHYALPLGERAAFGLSAVSPFGLSTSYGNSSAVRYQATNSKLVTYNVAPELAGRLTNNFSVGAGIDFQYATVEFNQMIGSPAVMNFLGFPASILDSESHNMGNSFGMGYHAGLLLMFDDNHTRIGLNYQSEMRHQFNGSSTLTGRLADPTLNLGLGPDTGNPNASYTTHTLSSNNIALPAVVTLSAYQDINQQFALLGSVIYTGWGCFRTIDLNNVAVSVPNPQDRAEIILTPHSISIPQDYKNVWRGALGANYHVNQQWMLRLGGGYDQTPTVNAHRDVRVPDADRWALSIGAHYQPFPSLGFDAGYTYLFAANTSLINNTQAIGATSVDTVYAVPNNHASLFGLQAVWTIDQKKVPATK